MTLTGMLGVTGCTMVGTGAPPTARPAAERPAGSGSDTRSGSGSGARSGSGSQIRRDPPDFRQDRPPEGADSVDLASIPDAEPRPEARSASGNGPEYEVFGRRYRVLPTAEGYVEEGVASWYGAEFQGRSTASGEPFDPFAMSAAHRTLPLPTYAEVTNLQNGRRVVVRINDRGPFHGGRLIDLSYAAAWRLGMVDAGTVRVRVRALVGPPEPSGPSRGFPHP